MVGPFMAALETSQAWSRPDLFSFAIAGGMTLLAVAVRRTKAGAWTIGGAMVLLMVILQLLNLVFFWLPWAFLALPRLCIKALKE